MAFGDDNFDLILPSYLASADKERLNEALKQFTFDQKGKEINYTGFYKTYQHLYFMQSDLVREIRLPVWDDKSASYSKGYTDAIIVSNSCDISSENKKDVNKKECLFAPLIDLEEYLKDLEDAGHKPERIQTFSKTVKSQLISNIFYLPRLDKENKEFIVLLDNLFWFPTYELNSYIDTIGENRITSLGQFGYYLFILKLSYHLCRLPEQCDREIYY